MANKITPSLLSVLSYSSIQSNGVLLFLLVTFRRAAGWSSLHPQVEGFETTGWRCAQYPALPLAGAASTDSR